MDKRSNAFMGYGKEVGGNTVPQTPPPVQKTTPPPVITPSVAAVDMPKVAELSKALKKLANG